MPSMVFIKSSADLRDEHRKMAVASVLSYLRSEPDSAAKTRAAGRKR
jgi:hypothetical protein